MNSNNSEKNGILPIIPVLAAVAVIICSAVYIVFKLAQHEAARKWSDYDDCGWS